MNKEKIEIPKEILDSKKEIREWARTELKEALEISKLSIISPEEIEAGVYAGCRIEKIILEECTTEKLQTVTLIDELNEKIAQRIQKLNIDFKKNVLCMPADQKREGILRFQEEKNEKLGEALESGRSEEIIEIMTNLTDAIMSDPKGEWLKGASKPVNMIIEKCIENKDLANQLFKLTQKDHITSNHVINTTLLIIGFCVYKGFSKEKTCEYAEGEMLHDIGKILVPDSILNKNGKPTEKEWEAIKKHPRESYRILREEGSFSQTALNMALYHQEKLNGKGYPEGLKGEEIPYEARLAAVVDVYDALMSNRQYKNAFDLTTTAKILRDNVKRGDLDAEIVEDFLESIGLKNKVPSNNPGAGVSRFDIFEKSK